MIKRIGIIGSRRRDTQEDYILTRREFLRIYERGDLIISGGCRQGGDRFAEMIAQEFGIDPIIHRPDESKIVRTRNYRADYARIAYDRDVLIAHDSTHLIACVHQDRRGGTEHTIQEFVNFHKLKVHYKFRQAEMIRRGLLILVPQVSEIL